jgi:hypothetical protein
LVDWSLSVWALFVNFNDRSRGMNERIRELVRESNLDVYGLGKERYKWDYTVEKFVELIIKDCVEQGKLIQAQTIVNGSEEYVAGREMGIEVFINQIKKHLGIEV